MWKYVCRGELLTAVALRENREHNKKGHNKAKAEVSASTEAISALIIPEAVKAQDAEGPPAANSVGFPKLGKQIQGYTVKGHRLC